MPIGKASFEKEKLLQNMASLMEAIVAAKPASLKGNYVERVTLTSTMGPGVKMETSGATCMRADNY